ncbi:MAG: phosphatidylglycerophosphatase A [bacterium]
MKKIWYYFSVFISSVSFVGYVPFAGGTAASAVGFIAAFFLPTDRLFFLITILIICVAVLPMIHSSEWYFGVDDDPRIVIDEVLGYFLSVALLPHSWKYFLAAFFLFRFFDIFKPKFIRESQNVPYGIGVVFDDILAAIITNLILQAFRYISYLFS